MEPIMNRVGEVYEPFKVHFLTKRIEKLQEDEVLIKVRASAICEERSAYCKRNASVCPTSGYDRT